ncbi:MAG: hypothetical protein FWG68_10165 [Defluviitaleaceae bacterium]|nr:hypothetical protein [Defluviitaleaceae bacterium]
MWVKTGDRPACRTGRGRSSHLRTLLLNHWGLDGRATEDGRPFPQKIV